MFKKRRAAIPDDPRAGGLAEIAAWEAWLLAANRQRMKDDGYDEAAITRELPAVETMVAAAAEKMREQYRARSPQP